MENSVIILFGLKHSGKSTLGKGLARELGWDFLDTDDLIEKAEGMTCRDLYNAKGAAAFMEAEAKVCASFAADSSKEKIVLSTGGGICDNPDAIKNLQNAGILLYLDTNPEISVRRIVRKINVDANGQFTNVPAFVRKQNPKTIDDIKKMLCDKFSDRAELYKKIDNIVPVKLADTSIEENVATLIKAVS